MPYKIIKDGKCYKVINSKTGKIHSNCSTEMKAKAQIRLLKNLEKKN